MSCCNWYVWSIIEAKLYTVEICQILEYCSITYQTADITFQWLVIRNTQSRKYVIIYTGNYVATSTPQYRSFFCFSVVQQWGRKQRRQGSSSTKKRTTDRARQIRWVQGNNGKGSTFTILLPYKSICWGKYVALSFSHSLCISFLR